MSKRPKILLIADHAPTSAGMVQWLSELPGEVVSVTTGQDALQAVQNHRFSVAIIRLQDMDSTGPNLVARLRSNDRTVGLPVLYIAASSSAQLPSPTTGAPLDIMSPNLKPAHLVQRVRFILECDARRQVLLDRIASSGRSAGAMARQIDTLFGVIQRTCLMSQRAGKTDLQPAIDASVQGQALASKLTDLGRLLGAESHPPGKPPLAKPKPERDTILVVEDNPAVRRMVVKVLVRGGYEVISAESYYSALDLADQTDHITMLFTDINLPGSNGIQVANAVRKLIPDIPVLFTSGNSSHNLRDQTFPPGRIGFIQKPFLPKSLIQKVKETIGIARPA
jgi:CheY-like chemotaxis protein